MQDIQIMVVQWVGTGALCWIFGYAALMVTRTLHKMEAIVDIVRRKFEEVPEGLFHVTVNVQPVIVNPVPQETKKLKTGLVCGNCGNEIKTNPVRGIVNEGKAMAVYKCETCSKEVTASPPTPPHP